MDLRFKIFFFVFWTCSFAEAQQTEKMYLSGRGSDDAVPWEFFCTGGMNSGRWTTIAVPSCWELQGFGKYDYGFAKDSVRGKEKGLYRYRFTVPSAWKHKVVKIVFRGSMTDTEVKINGVLAGEIHQGAFYSFSYDITSLLKYDAENLLEVSVSKHSSNASVNAAEREADYWIFGGIFRPVLLEAYPKTYIENVAFDAKANGALSLRVKWEGTADKISLQLYDRTGKQFGSTIIKVIGNTRDSVLLQRNFIAPLLWTAEHPHLYRAVMNLYANEKLVHTVSQQIGFRTVEVKQRDGLYVNGVKIKLKGVNRHSFRPATGRTTSKRISIEDVTLMKEMNMNAVRMSHYPPDDHFLDVCDSLGLFVMDELAGWHGHYDNETGSKRVKELVEHDRNHPSVILWANGNEGGHNFALDTIFHVYDLQQRPVVHPWQLFGGIETQHYREYNYGIGNYEQGKEIVMPTEFLHGMYDGGHGAGLEDYWEKMWHNPLSAGGFLWDFADQGVVRTDRNGMIDTDASRGADGIVGPFHEKEGSFFAIKEIWSPVYFYQREIAEGFDGTFHLENRYHYTNLSACSFSWQLSKFGNKREKSGSVPSPNIKPREKGILKIALPGDWSEYDALYVTVRDHYRKELFTWSFPITRPSSVAGQMVDTKGSNKIDLRLSDSAYHISTNGLMIQFDKQTGMLENVQTPRGTIPLSNGPVLQEGVNLFRGLAHRFIDSTLLVESTFSQKESYNTLQWTIYPSGWIKLVVRYFPSAYFTNMVGINFDFPEKEIKSVRYMGSGPYRVWKNRLKGGRFGVWDKEYNSTETGEAPWIYPEFKGYFKNMYWCRFETTSQPFTVVTENEDLFLRLFTPAFKTDPWKNYEPIFPSGDISFMQGITSIGSKTQRAETTGPMGMKHIFYDYEKDPARSLNITLYFNFLQNTSP